jgi:carbon monoxide dehydrogenase subunit G
MPMVKIHVVYGALLLTLLAGDSLAAGENHSRKEKAALGTIHGAAPGAIPNVPVGTLDPVESLDRNIHVRVRNDGEQVSLDATFVVPVPPQQAWLVFTDFENIPSFMPGVVVSKVNDRYGNRLRVSQKGVTRYGFVDFSFETVREVNLFPFQKIHERMLSGSMRKMEETTQFLPEGNYTRIVYHADIIPGTWVPPVVGNVFIKQEAREQFQQIVNEIIRRKTAGSL